MRNKRRGVATHLLVTLVQILGEAADKDDKSCALPVAFLHCRFVVRVHMLTRGHKAIEHG